MIDRAIRITRTGLIVTWLGLMAGLAGLIALPHAAPYLDREVFIVRGGSMAPSIPLGSLIVVRHVSPASVVDGDVITFRAETGTVVTHRVVDSVGGDPATFQTKGDASLDSDPRPVPAAALIGAVEMYVPYAGYLLAMLPSSVGTIGVIGVLGGLLLAIWFIDELLATRPGARVMHRGAVTEPAA
jgi:signal peptidase I